MVSHSQRLRTTISFAQRRLNLLIHEAWFHPRLGELYPELLFAMYGVAVASSPGMRYAAALCGEQYHDDPLHQWLQSYFLEHAAEEDGHTEWLLADLALMGIEPSSVQKRLPYPSIAALVGAQYYWMKHVDPIAYLGFLAVLESPAQMDFLREVAQRTGIPLECMSCHVRHAELDPEHVAEFDRTLDALAISAAQRELITVSAITSIGYLEDVFTEILEHFARIDQPHSAGTIFTTSVSVAA
jgi:hypothetical protein